MFVHLYGQRCKRAHALYGKSMYWGEPHGILEPTFDISRAACWGSLLDFWVFPDIEGAFPDLDSHIQKLKIAALALDLQFCALVP